MRLLLRFSFNIYFQLISVIIMSTEVRTRAIGMLEGGLTQKEVASRIGKDIRTIKRWWKRFTSNQSLDHKPGACRPSLLNPVAKMIIGKSLGKRHQSTRILSAKLKSKGYSISKSTVHSYLSKSLGVKEIAWSISKEIRKYHIVCLFVPKYTLTCNVSKYDGKSSIRSILDDV